MSEKIHQLVENDIEAEKRVLAFFKALTENCSIKLEANDVPGDAEDFEKLFDPADIEIPNETSIPAKVNKDRPTDPYSYYYWMARDDGDSHIVARNKAIDYLRKYTNREITSGWDSYKDTFVNPDAVSADSITQLNQVVGLVLNNSSFNEKHKRLILALCRYTDVDHFLKSEYQQQADQYFGNKYPDTMAEVSDMVGLASSRGGVSTRFYVYRDDIMNLLKSHNIKFAGF